jgi:outer membrane protein assembly factor BamB
VTNSHVRWRFNKQLPYVPSPIFYKGHLFMVRNGGIASCVDTAVGKRVKQVRLSNAHDYYSSPVIGDGMMLVVDESGAATLVTADSELKPISTARFDESTFATPALVDGRIYLRTAEHLYCFGR